MFDYLEEMGTFLISGMGDKTQLTYSEIYAYMQTTQTKLNRWEVMAIRTLSLEYVVQSQQKEVSDMPPCLETDEFTYLSNLRN